MPNALLGATVGSWVALAFLLTTPVIRGDLSEKLRVSFATFRPYFWLAGIGTIVGQLGFFLAITFAPVSHVSVIAASETLLTILLAAIFLRNSENVTSRITAAAVAVFTGAALVALS